MHFIQIFPISLCCLPGSHCSCILIFGISKALSALPHRSLPGRIVTWLVLYRIHLVPGPSEQKKHLSSLNWMSLPLTGTYTGINQALPSLLKVPLLTLLRQDSHLLILPWPLSSPSPCLPPIFCTPVGHPEAAEHLDTFPAHGPQLPCKEEQVLQGETSTCHSWVFQAAP